MSALPPPGATRVISRAELQTLIDTLADDGCEVLGPTCRDGAIVYDAIRDIDDLPAGWTDRQGPGRYRLERRDDGALFGYNVGPHSWKRFLHPPTVTLWRAQRTGDTFAVTTPSALAPRYAFIGVRACELKAMAIQDRVFCGGEPTDHGYAQRRRTAFIVAVNCGEAGDTCFCVSMDSGPKAEAGFDLALTELLDADGHRFLVEVGSDAGGAVLARLDARDPSRADVAAAEERVAHAAATMGRHMDTSGLKALLQDNPEHPRWDDVAERCLSCGNCTMVCPTCFCTTVTDHTSLDGACAERTRTWDSCFTMDFSYIHGGSVRHTARARYRQWMTHKLAHWVDQFGTSGCVGCGRCISWCPVGIDITAEAAAIRETASPQQKSPDGHA